MADETERAIADLEALIGMVDRCVAELTEARDLYSIVLTQMQAGGGTSEALEAGRVSETRLAVTTALDELDRARQVSRTSLFRAQIAEGSSVPEVAVVWGISRQLVARTIASAAVE